MAVVVVVVVVIVVVFVVVLLLLVALNNDADVQIIMIVITASEHTPLDTYYTFTNTNQNLVSKEFCKSRRCTVIDIS